MNSAEPIAATPFGRMLVAWFASLVTLLGVQLVVGFVLSRGYHGTLAQAHSDVMALRTGSGFDRFLLGFHYWGSFVLICFSFGLLALLLWNGLYRRPNQWFWLASLIIFFGALGLQITGNLLPMDRHDVQTAVVEAGIAGGAPIIGATIRSAALGGPTFGQTTLSLWGALHEIVFPGAAILISALGLYTVLRHRHAKTRWSYIAIPSLATAGLSFLGTPLGVAATPDDYGSYDALASWYTWPLHGSLRLFQTISSSLGWVGALVIPGLFTLFLVSLPILGARLSSSFSRGIFFGFLVYFGIAAIGFGGRFAPIVGDQGPFLTQSESGGSKPTLNPALALRGRVLFNTKGCATCHGKDGQNGDAAPDLTGEARKGRTLDWLQKYISNPGMVKAGSTMPAFAGKLAKDEMADIAQFLLQPKLE